jgi:CubicO group peptidase (beta-lactamase class C family)
MIVLTGDIKRFPDVNGVTEQGDIEINAPAFCDPGTSDRSNGTRICSRDDILRAIALRPLSFEPWTRPLYSNTGFNLLGWATAHAAHRNASRLEFQILEPEIEKKGPTLEELLHEDVFGPLGMKDTSFWVPLDKRDNVAVPAKGVPNMIDWEFTSTFNP